MAKMILPLEFVKPTHDKRRSNYIPEHYNLDSQFLMRGSCVIISCLESDIKQFNDYGKISVVLVLNESSRQNIFIEIFTR